MQQGAKSKQLWNLLSCKKIDVNLEHLSPEENTASMKHVLSTDAKQISLDLQKNPIQDLSS